MLKAFGLWRINENSWDCPVHRRKTIGGFHRRVKKFPEGSCESWPLAEVSQVAGEKMPARLQVKCSSTYRMKKKNVIRTWIRPRRQRRHSRDSLEKFCGLSVPLNLYKKDNGVLYNCSVYVTTSGWNNTEGGGDGGGGESFNETRNSQRRFSLYCTPHEKYQRVFIYYDLKGSKKNN